MSAPWGFVVADAAEQRARQEHAPPAAEPPVREVWENGYGEVTYDEWERE